MTDLLPCPFCGLNNLNVANTGSCWVSCLVPECGCEGPVCDTEDDALHAWNTRVSRSLGGAQAVPDDAADAARYRHLKEYCSYHYAEGYDPPTPREFGIQWEWIDTTPARPGMDWLIDQEIEAKRLETLEYEAEEAALALPSTHCGSGK